jgi:biotin carboxylase
MIEKYLWVIGGAELQIPLIKEAHKLGLKTIVSDLNTECVAKEITDIFVHLDIFDIEAHIDYAKKSNLNIIGILAAGIDVPETMAAMNEALGLKGVSLETALLVKNKDLFRVKLQELNYPMPVFKIINKTNIASLKSILETMPYPLIVKPTNNCGSRDMKIFNKNSQELEHFIEDKFQKYGLLLVEEMWIGKEQTVECLVDINGKFHNGFITDRNFTFKNGYPIETGLIHPSQLDNEKQKSLFALAKQISEDLKIEAGAVKLDTIYTKDGPRIIELTLRHSGGFDCQYLVPHSTGKNILKAAILTATGEEFNPSLLKNTLHKFGTTGSIWPKSGKIVNISGVNEARKIEGVEKIIILKKKGEEIREYIDCAARVVYIICSGKSLHKAKESLAKAQNIIKIETFYE